MSKHDKRDPDHRPVRRDDPPPSIPSDPTPEEEAAAGRALTRAFIYWFVLPLLAILIFTALTN